MDAYIGEIRMVPYNFAPQGWLNCDGSTVSITQYETLYSLLGTTYGGDGNTTFGLPDLRSRLPLHLGSGGGASYSLAQAGGLEQVTVLAQHLPIHSHPFMASNTNADQDGPRGNFPAVSQTSFYTADSGSVTALGPVGTTPAGGNQPHNNIMPYLGIAFIICTEGIYPSPN